ncbi:MAG: DNA-binding protein [Gammaproteobacteria bacterium GWF2_41_13]|nr:MAG: DNA-binding protein [Gammaproteobacteria bacterium GWF2_41_13]
MNFVLDASIALAFCFSDEATTETEILLDQLKTDVAIVPAHFGLELGNVLMGAERRKRITEKQIAEFLFLLEEINIQVDSETAERSFHDILLLAHSEKLTTYDAAYLELALRLKIPLATKDKLLQKAAKNKHIALLVTK